MFAFQKLEEKENIRREPQVTISTTIVDLVVIICTFGFHLGFYLFYGLPRSYFIHALPAIAFLMVAVVTEVFISLRFLYPKKNVHKKRFLGEDSHTSRLLEEEIYYQSSLPKPSLGFSRKLQKFFKTLRRNASTMRYGLVFPIFGLGFDLFWVSLWIVEAYSVVLFTSDLERPAFTIPGEKISTFIALEGACIHLANFIFLINYFASGSRRQFLTQLKTLMRIYTLPGGLILVSFLFSMLRSLPSDTFYLHEIYLYFGCFRFLRLFDQDLFFDNTFFAWNLFFKSFLNILAVIFSLAGTFYVSEGPAHVNGDLDGLQTFHDYIFLSILICAMIKPGDFTPRWTYGRIFAGLAIATILVSFSIYIANLIQSILDLRRVGNLKRKHDIVVFGITKPEYLNLLCDGCGSGNYLIVVPDVKIFRGFKDVGSELVDFCIVSTDRDISRQVKNAKSIIVYSDMAKAPKEADNEAILKTIELTQFLGKEQSKQIYLRLIKPTYFQPTISGLGIIQVSTFEEIKMKLLVMSLRTHGIESIVNSLLRKPVSIPETPEMTLNLYDTKLVAEKKNSFFRMIELLHVRSHCKSCYSLPISTNHVGWRFHKIVEEVFENNLIPVIGFWCNLDERFHLNCGNYVMKEEDTLLVIAEREEVKRLFEKTRRPRKISRNSHFVTKSPSQNEDHYKFFGDESLSRAKSLFELRQTRWKSLDHEEIVLFVGCPENIKRVLDYFRVLCPFSFVVILALELPDEVREESEFGDAINLPQFAGYVRGNGLKPEDLIRAGCTEVSKIIIFNTKARKYGLTDEFVSLVSNTLDEILGNDKKTEIICVLDNSRYGRFFGSSVLHTNNEFLRNFETSTARINGELFLNDAFNYYSASIIQKNTFSEIGLNLLVDLFCYGSASFNFLETRLPQNSLRLLKINRYYHGIPFARFFHDYYSKSHVIVIALRRSTIEDSEFSRWIMFPHGNVIIGPHDYCYCIENRELNI